MLFNLFRSLQPVCVCMSSCPPAAGEKAIVCDQCGAQFQTEESLEAHRQIHTGNTHAPHAHMHVRTHTCSWGWHVTAVNVAVGFVLKSLLMSVVLTNARDGWSGRKYCLKVPYLLPEFSVFDFMLMKIGADFYWRLQNFKNYGGIN